MIYISTAFSLSMLKERNTYLLITEITLNELKREINNKSVDFRIGHQSTAEIIGNIFNTKIIMDRTPLKLEWDKDILFVFQFLERPKEGEIWDREKVNQLIDNNKLVILKVEPLSHRGLASQL